MAIFGTKTCIISVLDSQARISLHLSDTQNDLLFIFALIVKWSGRWGHEGSVL